jgi:hypothetical protein
MSLELLQQIVNEQLLTVQQKRQSLSGKQRLPIIRGIS